MKHQNNVIFENEKVKLIFKVIGLLIIICASLIMMKTPIKNTNIFMNLIIIIKNGILQLFSKDMKTFIVILVAVIIVSSIKLIDVSFLLSRNILEEKMMKINDKKSGEYDNLNRKIRKLNVYDYRISEIPTAVVAVVGVMIAILGVSPYFAICIIGICTLAYVFVGAH